MTEMKKVLLVIGAVFCVALLLSAAVLSPFSVDSASAENEMTEEEKQAYINARIAELTADSNEQMLKEYGITFEEYATAVDFLAENPIVLTSDEDGTIVADSLDSVDAGRCLWESGFNGNNFNIYIDSVTWSTFVFFFSNDFVNMAVDNYTGKERNDVNNAENEYNAKTAACNSAIADYDRADSEYKVAVAELNEATKQYLEAKAAYDAAVSECNTADANVAALSSSVDELQRIVDETQMEVDSLEAECEEEKAAVQQILDDIIDSMADVFCDMTTYVVMMNILAEEKQNEFNGAVGDLISALLEDIYFGTYIKDTAILAVLGLTETTLDARYMTVIVEKLYDKFKIGNIISKSDVLSLFAKKASERYNCMKYIVDKITTTIWNKGINAAVFFENKGLSYADAIDEANTKLDVKKTELRGEADRFKTAGKELREDLGGYADRVKEFVNEKSQLVTKKASLDDAVKVANAKQATVLEKGKQLVDNADSKNKGITKVLSKETLKETYGKAVSVAKAAKNTAWESLKTAKQGLAVAKEIAKRTAAEAGKVACKAALKTALACFGAVSIIIDIILALVMKFIMDHLSVNEPPNGIEISVKVQDSFCIWGCRIWYPVFPSLNYIRAQ